MTPQYAMQQGSGAGGFLKMFQPPQIMGPLTNQSLTPADYAFLIQNGAQVKRMFRDRIYDQQRYISGTAVPTSEIIVFSIPQGQQGNVINATATTYSKTDVDTNINQSNQLPKGDIFICTSVQVMAQFVGALDTTITSGRALSPVPTGTPPSVTNNMRCLLNGATIKLTVGSFQFEYAPLWAFPAGPYALSGFAGAGISTTSTESFIQNGIGRPVECKPWHVIDPGRNFMLRLNWRDAWTPQGLFYLTFMLDGFRLTDTG